MPKRLLGCALVVGAISATFAPVAARELSFDERVRAEAAILRVYHAHTLGSPPPFEQVYPRELLESRVRRYLRLSLLLEQQWHTPIGPEALSTEARRIAERTRLPQRLQELYDALGRDAFLFEECVARASLVDRLTRSFLEGEGEPGLDAADVRAVSTATVLPDKTSGLVCSGDDTWLASSLDAAPDARALHGAVWTGSLMLMWGGTLPLGEAARTGLRYDPLTDTWSPMSTANAPTIDYGGNMASAWTGTEMIVWGGSGFEGASGGRYDPMTDSWTPMAQGGPSVSVPRPASVWTGEEFIVCRPDYECGRYDPSEDSWTLTGITGPPWMRDGQSAIWTGSEMIVFGGTDYGNPSVNTGWRYTPRNNKWRQLTTVGAPGRAFHTAVWTGSQMIVWGGEVSPSELPELGARYTPATETWEPLPASSLVGRRGHTAIWTGSEMIVWGGENRGGPPFPVFNDGGRYNPVTNTWTLVPSLGAPSERQSHSAIWDGTRMIVFGGLGPNHVWLGDGSRYNPLDGSWTPVSLGPAPSPRMDHATVWTGSEMIVWGGRSNYPPYERLNTGARYDPLLDQWSPTSIVGAPEGRRNPLMVWTGSEAIVWGGRFDSGETSTGGRYSPSSDSWSPTSTNGAPSPQLNSFRTMIWAGTEAIVWDGLLMTGGATIRMPICGIRCRLRARPVNAGGTRPNDRLGRL